MIHINAPISTQQKVITLLYSKFIPFGVHVPQHIVHFRVKRTTRASARGERVRDKCSGIDSINGDDKFLVSMMTVLHIAIII